MRAEYADYGQEVTYDNVNDIYFDGERIFAYACLEAGCFVYTQIDIEGDSNIDFYVINPRRLDANANTGKLVEVTQHPMLDIAVPNHLTLEFTGPAHRKHRQIAHMQQTGEPWTILYGENLAKIESVSGDPAKHYLDSQDSEE